MCKPVGTRTLQRGVTNTNLAWTGLRRNDFTLRIVIRSGSAGKESARISARRLQRSFRFAARCGGWLDLSESCGARKSICGTWMLGRAWSAIFGSDAADTNEVRAAGFTNGAQTWRAPVAGSWAFDHRSGRCSLDACRLHENESGQDFCCCGFGDERPDAACSLRGDPPHYENFPGREGK